MAVERRERCSEAEAVSVSENVSVSTVVEDGEK